MPVFPCFSSLLRAHQSQERKRQYPPPKRSLFQLLAPVQRVTKFEQLGVVLGDLVDKMASRVNLAQCELIVVFVVEDVHQVGIERVNVLDLGE
ncbi:hypothetical protein BC936DRAFT_139126 [Jimgerdemannia flammicorona]|uniref:Uncharacterized protein n=2 Tax=Jimgerdemannia flammicorona TaxID=994334 RepID=A0A433BAL2_9FUNG|nr:hypothetical protein BC936DRAFT_139126 [Jimgerdemannia flammicorona]RUS25277.1 hypothetical protein BC938DRAFT_472390 [Jimgerdemannia flammicorona]